MSAELSKYLPLSAPIEIQVRLIIQIFLCPHIQVYRTIIIDKGYYKAREEPSRHSASHFQQQHHFSVSLAWPFIYLMLYQCSLMLRAFNYYELWSVISPLQPFPNIHMKVPHICRAGINNIVSMAFHPLFLIATLISKLLSKFHFYTKWGRKAYIKFQVFIEVLFHHQYYPQ